MNQRKVSLPPPPPPPPPTFFSTGSVQVQACCTAPLVVYRSRYVAHPDRMRIPHALVKCASQIFPQHPVPVKNPCPHSRPSSTSQTRHPSNASPQMALNLALQNASSPPFPSTSNTSHIRPRRVKLATAPRTDERHPARWILSTWALAMLNTPLILSSLLVSLLRPFHPPVLSPLPSSLLKSRPSTFQTSIRYIVLSPFATPLTSTRNP